MTVPLKKILVTGSSGTIGTRLCEQFLAQGQLFVGVDRCPNKWISEVQDHTLLVDLCDPLQVETLPSDVDMVIHLAANARVYDLVKEPQLALENVTSLFNILEYCKRYHIPKFIFSSSRESYGNVSHSFVSESQVYLENCESPYAASKIAGEVFVHSYRQCFGIDPVIVRFSNVYGLYDESDRLVPLFIRQCRENEPLTIYGAQKCLDFTHSDDAVAGLFAILQHWDHASGKTFNLSYGEGVSLKRLAELIKSELKSNVSIQIEDNRPGEVLQYVANLEQAKKYLGFQPKVSIQEGIRRSVEWYLTTL